MKHYFYAFGAILCWASLPAATGSGLSGLTTEELLFYSFSAAAFFLYFQNALFHRSLAISFPSFKACLFGIWGIFSYHYIYYLALERTPLAEGAILATTWSLWIVIFSSFLQLKRIAPSIALAAIIGFSGAAMVIGSGEEISFQSTHMVGFLLALSCGLIWSSFSVGLSVLKVKKEPMTAFTILAALCSTLPYLLTLPHQIPSRQAIGAAIYLGCIPLGLSFFLWNRAVKGGNLVMIGFLSYLTPPLAVMMVAIIHHERISWLVTAGMLTIIGSSMLGRYFLDKLTRTK